MNLRQLLLLGRNEYRHDKLFVMVKDFDAAMRTLFENVGASPPVNTTYADLLALQSSSGLIAGQWYYVTDRTTWIEAIAVNQFGEENCYFNDTTISEVHLIHWDFANDYVYRRVDHRGNDVSISSKYSGGDQTWLMNEFLWGDDEVTGNVIVDSRITMKSGGNTYAGKFQNNLVRGNVVMNLSGLVTLTTNIISACEFSNGTTVTFNADLTTAMNWNRSFFTNRSSIIIQGAIGPDITTTTVKDQSVVTFPTNDKYSLDQVKVELGSVLTGIGTTGALTTTTIFNANITDASALMLFPTVNLNASYLNVSSASVVDLSRSSEVQIVNASNGSYVWIDSCTQKIASIKADNNCYIRVQSVTAQHVTGVYTADSSTALILTSTGAIDNISITEGSSLIVNTNSVSQGYLKINGGWGFRLDADVSHKLNNWFKVFMGPGYNGLGYTWATDIALTLAAGSLVANKIVLSTDTDSIHRYTSVWTITGLSTNPAAPTVIDGFTNPSSLKAGSLVTIKTENDNGAGSTVYLQLQKGTRGTPIPAGELAMPANADLEGDDTNAGGESVTFGVSNAKVLVQLNSISIR